jgi:SpoVK/Ycf46/Vps4 family AAA+-type ATPase
MARESGVGAKGARNLLAGVKERLAAALSWLPHVPGPPFFLLAGWAALAGAFGAVAAMRLLRALRTPRAITSGATEPPAPLQLPAPAAEPPLPATAARPPVRVAPLSLNEWEKLMARDLVRGEDMEATFESIGGLAGPLAQVQELVTLPLSRPELFAHSALLLQPTGVLLVGPPGTGKTLLARAIARSVCASFLCVNAASVEQKVGH